MQPGDIDSIPELCAPVFKITSHVHTLDFLLEVAFYTDTPDCRHHASFWVR